jgi:hypothetical protein
LFVLAAFLLVGCTSRKPVAISPTVSTQAFMIGIPPSEVYQRIYARMDACHAVHNLFDPGGIVGGMDADGRHGRIYFANDGLALWGAEFESAENGTKVVTRIGKDATSERYHSLIRIWVEARRRPPPGETEC